MDAVISRFQSELAALHGDIRLTVNRILCISLYRKGTVSGNREVRFRIDGRLVVLRAASQIRDRILRAILQDNCDTRTALEYQRRIGRIADCEAVKNQLDFRALFCICHQLTFGEVSAKYIGTCLLDGHCAVCSNRAVAANRDITAIRADDGCIGRVLHSAFSVFRIRLRCTPRRKACSRARIASAGAERHCEGECCRRQYKVFLFHKIAPFRQIMAPKDFFGCLFVDGHTLPSEAERKLKETGISVKTL